MIYTSSFIGIPLPQLYMQDFAKLQTEIKSICPEISLADPATPHITLYYLDKQAFSDLKRVAKIVENEKDSLASTTISLDKIGIFNPNKPRVIFLEPDFNKDLATLNSKFRQSLAKFRADEEYKEFHPHITLGRFRNHKSVEEYKENKERIAGLIAKYNWNFKPEEIIIYGVNSLIEPEKQQRLIEIKI